MCLCLIITVSVQEVGPTLPSVISLVPRLPRKTEGGSWLYVRVAEEFVARNYMQPQSGHVNALTTDACTA